jgi:hypothetical protein
MKVLGGGGKAEREEERGDGFLLWLAAKGE